MSDVKADDAMYKIWKEWLEFYQKHFRAEGLGISAADQMAFYEIAQPVFRGIVDAQVTDERVDAAARVMWNDQYARYAGPWEEQKPERVIVVQVRATARAAVEAAFLS